MAIFLFHSIFLELAPRRIELSELQRIPCKHVNVRGGGGWVTEVPEIFNLEIPSKNEILIDWRLFVVTQDPRAQGHQRERGECLGAHQREHSRGEEREGG